jgi:chaperonin cofactor prefoldin
LGNKGRSGRSGIISEKENELIKRADNRELLIKERNSILIKDVKTKQDEGRLKAINRELNEISTRLSALVKNLHKRIIDNELDWRTILQSVSLRPLAVISYKHFVRFPYPYEGDYDNYGIMQSMGEFFKPKFEEFDGTEIVPNYSTWKVKFRYDQKRGERLYWLETEIKPIPTTEDIFSPEFSIKRIKGVWNRKRGSKIEKFDVRVILKKALDLEKRFQSKIRRGELPQIIPRTEGEAMDIITIEQRILDFLKIKETHDAEVPLIEDPTDKDYRVRAGSERWLTKEGERLEMAYASVKDDIEKIEARLKKYGVKIETKFGPLDSH